MNMPQAYHPFSRIVKRQPFEPQKKPLLRRNSSEKHPKFPIYSYLSLTVGDIIYPETKNPLARPCRIW